MESTVTTERKITNYTFNWKITRFDSICSKNCSKFDAMCSETFTVGGDGEIKSKWYVQIEGESNHIECYLYFDSSTNSDGTNNPGSVLCHSTFILNRDGQETIEKIAGEHAFLPETGYGFDKFVSIKELYAKQDILMPNNTLIICIRMQIFGEFENNFSTIFLPELFRHVDTLPTLSSDFEELLNSKKFSDVEIICGTDTFHAHKSILGARSKVFCAMFASQMAEVATSKIVLTDIDSNIFRAILSYIYSGKVELSDTTSPSHIELIYGAEKYELIGLKQHCFNEICRNVSDEAVGDLAVAAEMYNANDEIKNHIKDYCQRNMVKLLKRPVFKNLVLTNPSAFF